MVSIKLATYLQPMPGIKELKTRIKSISSTRKITRAMQLVSAAKMKKAQNLTVQSRAYSSLAWEMIETLASQGVYQHPLIKTHPKAKKQAIVLISSNRGLVGSLNTNLMGKVKEMDPVSTNNGIYNQNLICEVITLGKKGQILSSRMGKTIHADFTKLDKTAKIEDIYPIAQEISKMYSSGAYKTINLIYNFFHSTLNQKPIIKQLLPFNKNLQENLSTSENDTPEGYEEYIFEPDPKDVVEHLIPRIIESQIYQALLEADASEHSARMVMMKNATEAAGDLISDLTLTFNQLRQNKITTELAEITAGKIALE